MDSIEDHILHIPPTLQTNLETTSTSFPQPIPIKDSMTVVDAPQSNQHSQQVNQSYLFDESNQLPHGQVEQCWSDFQDSTLKANSTAAIITSITDAISVSHLPVPEPTIFSGEPIQYPDWKSCFHALIDQKALPSSDKVNYLKRYVGGAAREAITGLFLQNSSEVYERVWSILDERFGFAPSS